MKERWKVLDLFSGCGGMSSGFLAHQNYFEIVGAVDLEVAKPGRGVSPGSSTNCNSTYERNIGVEPLNADLGVLDPGELRTRLHLKKGDLAVLVSCPPCTGFSQKNSRNHMDDDPRNLLVERTADFVDEFRPEFFLMENVKELLKGNQNHHFLNLRQRLEQDLGYSVWAEIHDLAEFGLAQRRIRALILAGRDGPVTGPIPETSREKSIRAVIGDLPPIEGGEAHPSDPMHVSPGNGPNVLERLKAIPHDGGSWADVMNDPALSKAEKEHLLIPSMFRGKPGSFPDVYGRLAWEHPCVTITRECAHVGNGRYVHPEQDRLLSVREMSLLQGFPPDYVFEGPLTAKYNQIGDSVPPLISEQLASHIIRLKKGEIDVEKELHRKAPQMSFLSPE